MTDEEILEKAAYLIAANHSTSLAEMIIPLFSKMKSNHRSSGIGARQNWLRCLRALGETCLTVEKMEK